MTLLVNLSPLFLGSNWMQAQCLSGNVTAKFELMSLTMTTYSNSLIYEPNHLLAQHIKQPQSGNRHSTPGKLITSFATNVTSSSNYVCCKEKYPLYSCPKFKSLTHDGMLSTLKSKGFCLNCLRPGRYVKDCSSSHRCRMAPLPKPEQS